jgi:hypothetical protein
LKDGSDGASEECWNYSEPPKKWKQQGEGKRTRQAGINWDGSKVTLLTSKCDNDKLSTSMGAAHPAALSAAAHSILARTAAAREPTSSSLLALVTVITSTSGRALSLST